MAMTGMGGSTTVVVVSIGGSVPSPGVAAPGARVVAVPGSAATVAGTLPTGSVVRGALGGDGRLRGDGGLAGPQALLDVVRLRAWR